MKLWAGRFKESSSTLLDEFNNSIKFDHILYTYDIQGSIAHVKMLEKIKIITSKEKELIIEGLNAIKRDIEKNKITFDISDEDIHMAIEKELIQRIGSVGKKMHTGRSRNDQIALDMKLYVKENVKEIENNLLQLIETLNGLSKKYIQYFMPGYTHLQGAQIIRVGFYLQAYVEKFKRDVSRLQDYKKRVNTMPLGAGALAGVNYANDREFLKDMLGFDEITNNALDTVSDRDYIIELLSHFSMIQLHLSRFCEEIIIFSSQNYKFVETSDAYSTGSSIMPQKKNPDVAELIRGHSGKVFGNLQGMLTMMKGLPLAYNKDMQDDKKYLFESMNIISSSLIIFNQMIQTMTFNKEAMEEACAEGYLQATDLADYLVEKGLEFRESHKVVGNLVQELIEKNKKFTDLDLAAYKKVSPLFEKDVFKLFDFEYSTDLKQSEGSTSFDSVEKMIEINEKWLNEVM